MNRRALLEQGLLVCAAWISVETIDGSNPNAAEDLTDLESRYVEQTLSTSSLSLLSSQAAVRNLNNEDVRQFANFEIGEQQVLADVLTAVRRSKSLSNVLSPPSDAEAKIHMDSGDKRALESLTAGVYGNEYDRNYLKGQRDGHQKLLRIQDNYLEKGKDERIVLIAKLARSRIHEHLQMIEVLRRAVE